MDVVRLSVLAPAAPPPACRGAACVLSDGITANKQHSDVTPCGRSSRSPDSSREGGRAHDPTGSPAGCPHHPDLPVEGLTLLGTSQSSHLTRRLAPAAAPSPTPPARPGGLFLALSYPRPHRTDPPSALHTLPKGPAPRLPCAPFCELGGPRWPCSSGSHLQERLLIWAEVVCGDLLDLEHPDPALRTALLSPLWTRPHPSQAQSHPEMCRRSLCPQKGPLSLQGSQHGPSLRLRAWEEPSSPSAGPRVCLPSPSCCLGAGGSQSRVPLSWPGHRPPAEGAAVHPLSLDPKLSRRSLSVGRVLQAALSRAPTCSPRA